ncbi:MAG TPA: EAL domain-containing protein [Terracidiphilus sp.]|nr:EAL domain-containing protein [Terracidiphilus sp.]
MTGPLIQAEFRLALDERLTVLSVSTGIDALLGFCAEDFLTSRVSLKDRIHTDDADIAGMLFSPKAADESGTFNIRLRHADGKIRCVRGQYTREPAKVAWKAVLNLVLQDAQSLYGILDEPASLTTVGPMMDIVEEALYFKNRNHVFTAANRVALKALSNAGAGANGLLGQTDYDLFPEKDADLYYRLEREVFAGNLVVTDTQAILAGSGQQKWVDNRKHPVKDLNGEVIGLFGVARDITKRVETEAALRESEESLREVQRIAGLGSYVTDIRGGTWTSSAVLDQLFGIDKGYERTVEGWAALVHPDDRAMMADYLGNEVLGKGEPFNKEYRIVRHSDGAMRWVHCLGRLEFDVQGRPVKIFGSIRDITERKQSEIALRESKELLQLFIEHAPAGLAMFDRKMCYLAASRRWLEMHSLLDREIVGHSQYEVFPELPESWREEHRRALAGEALPADERFLERAGGTVGWVRREIIPWRTGDGSVGGVIIFAEDITEQRETEERLRLAASVFTNAREGITITDPAGTILEVNDMFTRITGYHREEVLGQNPNLLKSGLHSKEFYDEMWRALVKEGHWSGEIWNKNKSGDIFAEMLTITAVHDAGGKLLQYVALFSDITQIKKHAQQLEHLTHYDVLTSLPNRALLADRLHQAMAQANRRKQVLAVAYLDLDGFKGINDRHGHEAGDRLLTSLAFNMKCALREGDTLARLGGDEFVAVMLDLDNAEASVPVLALLLEAASEQVQVGDLSLCVSASIGVAFYPQAEVADPDLLLRQADQAMYQAKLAGGNRYHIFDPDHDQSVRGRHENLEHIRNALAAREFVLFYQPKVNMRTGKVVGVEALIRWQHPIRGLLPPGMFLPVIEDHSLAIEVGEWVIDSALAQMESWHAAGLDMPVSVNVCALQLQQTDFVDRLGNLLAAHPNVKPFSLEIEVLETSALQDVVQTSQVLNACHSIGVAFALDDFGTGYSSLTYLKRLPASILKIDQSFVSDMLEDPENLNILEGILGLALAFHRQVIAEGVETVEHGLMLLQLGCELAQGYGIARPMPARDLPGWVSGWRPDPRWAEVPPVHAGNRALLYACVEHRAWIAAFESFLQGKRHTPPALDIHHCRFGMWLDAEEKAGRGEEPACRSVETAHRHFHELAAEIFAAQAQGRNSEGIGRLGELRGLCDELLEQLEMLRLVS